MKINLKIEIQKLFKEEIVHETFKKLCFFTKNRIIMQIFATGMITLSKIDHRINFTNFFLIRPD